MKAKWIAGVLLAAITISACDDDTAQVGSSLTKDTDHFSIVADTFNVATRSVVVDSVLSQNSTCYLGRIKDPSTGDYVTSDFTTQFVQLEALATNLFPDKSDMVSLDGQGGIIADSCHLNIYIASCTGDTLAPMTLKAYELKKPVAEGQFYYTDFDPVGDELIRNDGILKTKTYTFVDFLKSEKLRNTSNYIPYINIPLNEAYTSQAGKSYNNYGTYVMDMFYTHPEYFKNSFTFTSHVCPGFYFKSTDGAGLMSQIHTTELKVYYRYMKGDSLIYANRTFTGTTEVRQTTTITNDKQRLEELAADQSCTYLKTPAGIFTEVTLPVDDIMRGHENDTITSAKMVFRSWQKDSDEAFGNAPALVMLPKDKVFTFFEENNLPDNKTSYLAVLNSKSQTYEFNNLSTLIATLYQNRATGGEDWNKLVLVPVERTTSTSTATMTGSTTTTTTKVSNLMSLTNTRLVGGSQNEHEPVTISIIYSKNQ